MSRERFPGAGAPTAHACAVGWPARSGGGRRGRSLDD